MDPEIYKFVDVITPNEGELRILSGLRPDDPADTVKLAKDLLAQGVKNVIVTRGSKGALIVEENGQTTAVPGIPVRVVDTTGAGDAFNAALAISLAEGRPLLEAVTFATAGGAFACTKLGVIPGLPYRRDLEFLLGSAADEGTQ